MSDLRTLAERKKTAMRRRKRFRSHFHLKTQIKRQSRSSEEIFLNLASFYYLSNSRWDQKKGRYVKLVFVEKMIDHLFIDSFILEAESESGVEQMTKYGVPEYHIGSPSHCI